MRTLVDLLNDDRGYVRIYADLEGFSYQLCTYRPAPIADLFEQMSGYASAVDAYQAAQYQLSSVHQTKRRPRKRARRLASATASRDSQKSARVQ
jgi:hypothetical protein